VFEMPMPLIGEYASVRQQAFGEKPDGQNLNCFLAMCHLKLKLYQKALTAFEKAMDDNPDNSEARFYAAICLLQGKKAFLAPRATIDKVEEYLNSAIMIEPRGIYSYFLAYIKYDSFARKYLLTEPDWQQILANAKTAGYSPFDSEQLFSILCVDKPDVLRD
jgi:tetratricopeptide (TPR) repeat protein